MALVAHSTLFCVTHKYTINKKILETIDRHDATAKARKLSLRRKIIYCAVGTLIVGSSIAGAYFYINSSNDELAKQLFNQEMKQHSDLTLAMKNVSNAYPNAKLRSVSNYFTKKETPMLDRKPVPLPPAPPPPPMVPSNHGKDINKDKKLGPKNNLSEHKPNNGQIPQQSILIDQKNQLRKAADRLPARASVNANQPSFLDDIANNKQSLKKASERQLPDRPPALAKTDSLIQQISSSNLFEQVARANRDEEDDNSNEWEWDENS